MGKQNLVLLGFLAGFLISVNAQGGPPVCNVTQLNACKTTFRQNTGVDLDLPWMQLRNSVENIFSNNSEVAFRTLCKGWQDFRTCLINDTYACFNMPYIIQNWPNVNYNTTTAYHVLQVYLQSHFTCGAGFNVFLQNLAYMTGIWNSQRAQIETYRDFFEFSVNSNQGSQELQQLICGFGYEYQENMAYLFIGSAQNSHIDAAWWACEYARYYVTTPYPHCTTYENACNTRKIIAPPANAEKGAKTVSKKKEVKPRIPRKLSPNRNA